MSNERTISLQLQQLHKRRNRLSRKWYQATRANHGEASVLRRQIASIDQDIEALEKQLSVHRKGYQDEQ